MLRDPTHQFRQMWEARSFMRRAPGDGGSFLCFERHREDEFRHQDASVFFDGVKKGTVCESNWFEGVPGDLGTLNQAPTFTAQAPALLGFDETIDDFCMADHEYFSNRIYDDNNHAGKCANSNNNILALWGDRLVYNTCRNLEWQVCAVMGKLPGQGGNGMRFSYNPGNLDVYDGGTGKSLGTCRGYLPPNLNCGNGFATDDIYFLEVCLVSFLCKNKEELFTVEPHDFYVCDFDGDAFDELQALLMQPPMY